MKTVALAAIACLWLMGCGKKEEPGRPQQTKWCATVTILDVRKTSEADTTLMEVTEEPRARLSRSGYFGAVGDRFQYCE